MLLQFAATLLGIFALVALVTAGTGIYGLTSYGVTKRRAALTLAVRLVAAVVIGAVLGLYAWRRLGTLIEPFLTNLTVTPSDPRLLVAVGGVLSATALAAGIVPALRAKRVTR
jgi:ABC-type antimicrobial peptide transport system permease subunit